VPAHLTLSPSTASYQQTVTVTGTGFGPNDAVSVVWGPAPWTPVAATTASASGSFVARFGVQLAISGTHPVVALGQPSGTSALALVQVRPRLILSPISGSAASQVATSGFGFGSQEQVRVFWDGLPPPMGAITTTALGSFPARVP
jgi:hypothetical protein